MNSTKNIKEKELIIKNADDISLLRSEEPLVKCENMFAESYFISDRELELFKPGEMMEYCPESPSDIEDMLNNLWEKRESKDMTAFNQVCVISAMKNRHAEIKSERLSVSSAVYEF